MFAIFNKLKSISSTNEKLDYLKSNSDNETLKRVLFYAYNPLYNYYVKEFETPKVFDNSEKFESIFECLDKLRKREVTGNNARNLLTSCASKLNVYDAEILSMIIQRDVDCGINVKSINKVFPNFIPSIPYQRCSLMDKVNRIKFPAFVQKKADGAFVNIIWNEGNVSFITRNGSEIKLKKLASLFKEKMANVAPCVIHGELLVEVSDKLLSRKEGNGMVNSLIKAEDTLNSFEKKLEKAKNKEKIKVEWNKKIEELNFIDSNTFVEVWDLVSMEDFVRGESFTPYDQRLEELKNVLNIFESSDVRLIETEIVNNLDEAVAYFERMVSLGYEGSILKNKKVLWKNHTSPEQIKFKSEFVCELRVEGFLYGDEGKYQEGIGSLCCVSEDGLVAVNVSGLTDAQKGFERVDPEDSSKGIKLIDGFNLNQYNGKIVSVIFNGLIESKSKDTFSLFLPKFDDFRFDKDEADTLERIKEIVTPKKVEK